MMEHTDYRLALILPRSRQLLALTGPGAAELPTVRIPMWQRPAEQLTRQVEERWKIRTIILDTLVAPCSDTPCAVAEVRTDSWDFESEGFCLVQPANIGDASLGDGQRQCLEAILFKNGAENGAFSRIGWMDDAQRWIQSSVRDLEVIFTGEIRQLNGGGTFCLLRLGTQTGPAYWIKGVGDPNVHEFAVTHYLAQHCPEYLPPVAGMRTDWNAWAMEEFGSSLHNSDSLDDFRRAASRLANLQKRLAGRSEQLLRAQCADHRTEVLASHIDEVIEYLDGAMRQQTSAKALPISRSRLLEIGGILHDACAALTKLRIPDSIVNNDISLFNILCDGTGVVFTDWCEACVGNPFVTFEQLCVQAARRTDEPESWIRSLRITYASCWINVLTEHQIDVAFQIAPLVSVFSHLFGRGDWLHTSARNDPAFLSHSRSLARHMDRIAARSELMRGICRQH